MGKYKNSLRIFLLSGLCFMLAFSGCGEKNDIPDLVGEYLGQSAPGMHPEVFAPGLISHGFHEHRLTMSPDGSLFVYVMSDMSYQMYTLVEVRCMDGKWQKPQVAPFSGKYSDYSPSFSPDGKRLYFASKRPKREGESLSDNDLWVVDLTDGVWGDPVRLPDVINTDMPEVNPCVSANGTLYFQSRRDGGWDLYSSDFENDKYSVPQKLPEGINTEHNESSPFIVPDERLLLFHSNRPGGLGVMDLYGSRRQSDGSWGDPINLGKNVNSSASDFGPRLTPDGKYLFFASYRRHGPSHYSDKTYDELLVLYRSPQNGYATIYWVDASVIDNAFNKQKEMK